MLGNVNIRPKGRQDKIPSNVAKFVSDFAHFFSRGTFLHEAVVSEILWKNFASISDLTNLWMMKEQDVYTIKRWALYSKVRQFLRSPRHATCLPRLILPCAVQDLFPGRTDHENPQYMLNTSWKS